ncbi:protein Wnt-8a [Wyeomyia smithii]|uniref:protein Wnt-8a n=1 Tax=Wyeomyia smithii TaxID=174621 RepID=UPI002467D7E6|nr:protein Wnt-8a [Wyeomyia smithii]XP_055526046.1 protein Wnt-8a [Wyeomyia smithii]
MKLSLGVFAVLVLCSAKAEFSSPTSTDLLSDSIELALSSCRRQFRWERWNCPTMQFVSRRYPDARLDRETAFVRAISSASLIYTYARNCSRGSESDSQRCYGERGQDSGSWDSGNNLVKVGLDVKGYGDAHNRRAGWVAIQNAVRKYCRCHGVSGSCAMRTCWSTLKSFATIAAGVKRMYTEAKRLFVDNSGKLNGGRIRPDQLIFVHPSPDYCKRNVIPGWSGTFNRFCSLAKGPTVGPEERKSCRNLCRSCGLKVKKHVKEGERKCNCRFNWCCQVTCDKCLETVEEYRCQ